MIDIDKQPVLSRWQIAALGAVLAVVVFAVYVRTGGFEFVNYDDPKYVYENRHVLAGFSWENVKWAFTSFHASNWHPLTWLSLMADCQLSANHAQACHITNVILHTANTVLCFLTLYLLTGNAWPAFLVGALFGLHPLHVESVAWVAERKDVLSTLFWFLTMLAYLRYVRKGGLVSYLPVAVFFALGLMAKPMLVTLPFVLLLVDWWPLGRMAGAQGSSSPARRRRGSHSRHRPRQPAIGAHPMRLIAEKIPLFVLCVVSSMITMRAQGAVRVSFEVLPTTARIANAVVAYAVYLGKMFVPAGLSVYYPHSGTWPKWPVLGAALVLLAISGLVLAFGRQRRYLTVGWLWYLGTMIPVVGLVQVGVQSYADRYTYIPLTGAFIMIAFGADELLRRRRFGSAAGAGLRYGFAASLVLALSVGTWMQTGHWADNIKLYSHAIEVTDRNHMAHNNLGVSLRDAGRIDEAIEHWKKAVEILPQFDDAIINLGVGLIEQKRYGEAITYYKEYINGGNENFLVYNNLGNALKEIGEFGEAARYYNRALRFKGDAWQIHYNLGLVFYQVQKLDAAIGHYKEALRLSNNNPIVAEALTLAQSQKSRSVGQKNDSAQKPDEQRRN